MHRPRDRFERPARRGQFLDRFARRPAQNRCKEAYIAPRAAALSPSICPLRGAVVSALVGLGALVCGIPPARAQIVEPNGIRVPVGPGLQSYFTAQGEAINAVTDARITPGKFLPLCDFTATLVVRESGATAGIAWYNVPAADTGPPAQIQVIVSAATVGQVITAADIRGAREYAQGLIGFVLIKNLNGMPNVPVYYSEHTRNVLCSGCAMPDYWKMALVYQSTRIDNTYYLAFEDWEGANTTTWFDNDGDFNDQVFRITGVTCNGGGAPCETGMPGVCAAGITECQPGGDIICKPQITAGPETCDNRDNDCDGQVDDGDGLCGSGGMVCVEGRCVAPCSNLEVVCAFGWDCVNGLCVESACRQVSCPAGEVCRGGVCVGGCAGVVCPLGQRCQLGRCVDPCAGVTCPAGRVCEEGACVADCTCRACGPGRACASDGRCVDEGCERLTCTGAGQICYQGRCTDACGPAACPGGGLCVEGMCGPPMEIPVDAGSGTLIDASRPADAGGGPDLGGGGGRSGAGTGGTGANADGGDDARPGGGGGVMRVNVNQCGCSSGARGEGALASVLALVIALLILQGRRLGSSRSRWPLRRAERPSARRTPQHQ
jgi:hypothetical protein